MKLMCIVLCAASILGLIATPTAAYPKLGDLMVEEGTVWIVDKWVLSGPGPALWRTIKFELDLDKHIIRMSIEGQNDFKFYSMMTYNPLQKKIVGLGADNVGGMHSGLCRMEDATFVLRNERIGANGKVDNNEMVWTKVDSSTMRLGIHAIEQGDRRSSKPVGTCMYKRESQKGPK